MLIIMGCWLLGGKLSRLLEKGRRKWRCRVMGKGKYGLFGSRGIRSLVIRWSLGGRRGFRLLLGANINE